MCDALTDHFFPVPNTAQGIGGALIKTRNVLMSEMNGGHVIKLFLLLIRLEQFTRLD